MQVASLLRVLLLALLWGSSFLWIKIALDGLSPVQLTLARLAFGAAFLLTLCAVTRLRLPRPGRLWLHLTVVAAIGQAVPFTLFGVGEQTVSSGLAGVLNATTPLWTVIVAVLARQERRLGPIKIAGLLLGFGGTLLILAPWHNATGTIAGSLACIAAAMCYGVSLVYSSRFVMSRGVPALAVATVQITLGTVLLALATPVLGRQPVQLEPAVVVSVAVLGIAGTGYAFVLLNRLIGDIGPTSTSTVTYLLPVIAVLLGAVALGEELNARVLAGMVVVLLGVALTQRRQRREPAPPARQRLVGAARPAPDRAAPDRPGTPGS